MKLALYFRDLSIRKKLLAANVIVIFIPMLFLGWYAYASTKSSMEKQLLENMSHSLDQSAAEISYRLERQEKTINSIVFNPALIEGIGDKSLDFVRLLRVMNERIEPILTTNLYYSGDVKELMIYVEDRESSYGNFIMPSSSISHQEWYEQTKLSPGTHWWFIDGKLFATRNIYHTDTGKIIGIFYLELDYREAVLEVLEKIPVGQLVIISDGDRPLFTSEKQDHLQAFMQASPKNDKATVDGETYFLLSKPIASSNWTMKYFVSSANVHGEASKILSAAAMVVLFGMLILSLLLLLLSQTILKSIHELNEKMKRVEKGEKEVSFRVESRDEIGQLSMRFDKMLEKVNTLISEVYQAQIAQREAELAALQAQINPHFLYNTLSHINSKAVMLESDSISEMVTELASFYRTALNQGNNTISIRDELLNIRSYIGIQSRMHNSSFTASYSIDARILRYDMIKLILQPIVENAIEHGIDCREQGGGSLHVEGRQEGEDILFVIEDDGPGFSGAAFQSVMQRNDQGYGLRNVHERIQLFFGTRYGISLLSAEGEGRTRIQIKLPCYKSHTSS